MEFLNPTALFGFLALPLLLIPYLMRKKPQRVIFSSLLLLTESGASAQRRPLGKLRLPPGFFLQLLLLILLILTMAEPVLSVRPSQIAVVLDNSASMQTLEGDTTRFALAQEKARALIDDLGVTGKVELYRTTPRLEKIGAAPLAPSEATGAVAALEPYDLGEPAIDYDKALNQIARDRKHEQIYLLTDHPVEGQGEKMRAVTVGAPKDNLALLAFQVRRASLGGAPLEATAEVANYSVKEVRVKILLRGGGALLQSRELIVAAGQTARALFAGFAAHEFYEAEIDARDSLQLDNRAFAVAPAAATLRILGVSPRPQALASLSAIPGVMLDLIAPADYAKTERTGHALEIFHYAAPALPPRLPALFVLPPDNDMLAKSGTPIARAIVSGWRDPHPLTRYVNFTLFRPSYARPLTPRTAGDTIIESPQGPLAIAIERRGVRHLLLGFDPFPYLGRDNLPMSIFTLNFLDWFMESGGRGLAGGEPLALGETRPGDLLITPRGEKFSLDQAGGYFSGTFYQGIYQVRRIGSKELFAVNLQNANESDLRAPAPIAIGSGAGGGAGAAALFPYWSYPLLASLLALVVEWFVYPRMAPFGARARIGRTA